MRWQREQSFIISPTRDDDMPLMKFILPSTAYYFLIRRATPLPRERRHADVI